ncbi:RNA polymerase sigma factor RpoH [Bathymodiolus thermophilus thioautotrophic gill symbiont]|jgi:RNA polymerase sigma-32 factor|uniref:RNA polymerase sigma factor RpoH n=3 Tax=sulfur-oxidizing symbionts TaxID=32036 RepID=A0ACA8ZNY8_9GAMM|nr:MULTISPECIES: RNA polymerase sigma factor RpoH [sulfur-oxidizing symbionts]CAC9523824.1 RNA polymerase sigma factor RpoH [uncultured Gammaproteobacteria bacterium]CAB5496548.1 RNA polymerase sigma factor RpoH [Bathymodiolus azoricus thioautotrophic gill symbiont]CAB5502552.1 RNA polymerase sigma factor RpoH [Bathymodiolus thermophilus thioautotrophic gill symbiont]CAC9986689.1 RNA polymerase sigma factor RpoH [uncultured Gammaproteobacteria bacterium]CAC9995156.1 RNA polymerase sigma factor
MSQNFALPTIQTFSTSTQDVSVQKYPPILSAQEEHDLAVELYENHDLSAARKLVLSHIRFVAFIAHGYKGYGLEQADLIQEGTIGLMKAVKKFNPYKNVRLASYAVYWIRAEIHEFVFKNWKIVKVATTKAQRKLFFKLKKAKANIYQSLNEKQAQEIADELGVRPKDVLEMESRLQFNDVTFEISDDEDNSAPERYLTNTNTKTPEQLLLSDDTQKHQQQQLYKALSTLDERSLDILQSRYLKEEKTTLYTLANKYGVSAERVRQLENKAMQQVKSSLEKA